MSGWTRNASGVKDGADCYRTIGGVRWTWWAEDADLFRAAGCRVRKAPDEGCFIHPADTDKAFAALSPKEVQQ
jgi:hypothetical protein